MSLNSKWVEFTVNALSLKFEKTLWADVCESIRNWGGTTISRPLGFIPRGLFLYKYLHDDQEFNQTNHLQRN